MIVLYVWQTNSIEFSGTLEHCFNWVIAAADGSAVNSLEGLTSCPTDISPTVAPAIQAVRVYLAKVPENDALGYGDPLHPRMAPAQQQASQRNVSHY